MRAAPAGPVFEIVQKSCTRAYRAAENIRHSLRNGLTAYFARSPENRALLSPSSADSWLIRARSGRLVFVDLTPITEASEPHDFTVRFNTARQHVP